MFHILFCVVPVCRVFWRVSSAAPSAVIPSCWLRGEYGNDLEKGCVQKWKRAKLVLQWVQSAAGSGLCLHASRKSGLPLLFPLLVCQFVYCVSNRDASW